MEDSHQSGVDHQEKILDALSVLKKEITLLSALIGPVVPEQEMTLKISGSFLTIHKHLELLETESKFFIELNTCKHIMLTDYLEHIKKLELELAVLKQ